MVKKDMVGQRFGRLTVLKEDDIKNEQQILRRKNGEIKSPCFYWLCLCDCGNTTSTKSTRLREGGVKSCGCLAKEVASKLQSKQNEYEELEDCYRGWDTKHENCFYISKEDYEEVKKYCWGMNAEFYWKGFLKGKKKTISLHQLIMMQLHKDYKPSLKIIPDHIGTIGRTQKENRADNTRSNLKLKSLSENSRNTKLYSTNTSGRKGVHWCERDKSWVVQIRDNNKKTKTKNFKSFEDACKQRLVWEHEFGYIGEIE